MRKLNIYGLAKKCKEVWSNILEIKDILEDGFESGDFSWDEFVQHGHPTKSENVTEPIKESVQEPAKDQSSENVELMVLDGVKELFDSYVGVLIVGFTTYKDDVPDIEKRIQALIVADVEIRSNDIWIKLNRINGGHGGYIKISPSVAGQFVEKDSKDEPSKSTRYRINFFGEDAIEYVDQDNVGQISYFAGYL